VNRKAERMKGRKKEGEGAGERENR